MLKFLLPYILAYIQHKAELEPDLDPQSKTAQLFGILIDKAIIGCAIIYMNIMEPYLRDW